MCEWYGGWQEWRVERWPALVAVAVLTSAESLFEVQVTIVRLHASLSTCRSYLCHALVLVRLTEEASSTLMLRAPPLVVHARLPRPSLSNITPTGGGFMVRLPHTGQARRETRNGGMAPRMTTWTWLWNADFPHEQTTRVSGLPSWGVQSRSSTSLTSCSTRASPHRPRRRWGRGARARAAGRWRPSDSVQDTRSRTG